jgi:hypothetical protein
MDVIIFGGQSNMQGASYTLPADNVPIDGAVEYKWNENRAVPMKHPAGETFSEYILAAAKEGGSLLPDFCKNYVKNTGREVFAIPCACGNTTVGQWLYGTQRYHYARQKIKAGIEYARAMGKVDHVYYIWLQGESDAVIETTAEEYTERIISYKNKLKEDFGIEKFCLIKVGYFCAINTWYRNCVASNEYGKTRDEIIMAAQEKLPELDSDFVMLTDAPTRLSLNDEYKNFDAIGHFNDKGYEIIGREAGEALAKITKGE